MLQTLIKLKKNSKMLVMSHLAALADIVPSIETPEKYFQSNVNGTKCTKSIKKI